jgi:hypothetical protein
VDTPEARAGSFAGIGLSSSMAFRLRGAQGAVGNLSGELATRGIFDMLFRAKRVKDVGLLKTVNTGQDASQNKRSRDITTHSALRPPACRFI